MNTPSEILPAESGEIDREMRLAGLPRKLKTLAGLVNLAAVFDALARRNFADDVDIFTGALQRPVEDSSVPSCNALIGDAETEQQTPAGKVLQCR